MVESVASGVKRIQPYDQGRLAWAAWRTKSATDVGGPSQSRPSIGEATGLCGFGLSSCLSSSRRGTRGTSIPRGVREVRLEPLSAMPIAVALVCAALALCPHFPHRCGQRQPATGGARRSGSSIPARLARDRLKGRGTHIRPTRLAEPAMNRVPALSISHEPEAGTGWKERNLSQRIREPQVSLEPRKLSVRVLSTELRTY